MYTRLNPLKTPEDFDFPFTPYKIQQQLMHEVYEILESKKIGIIESPTGTGKSLTLTCAALKWLEDHLNQINIELKDRLQQVTNELNRLEIECEQTKNWFEMHKETTTLREELMKFKEYHKLSQDYEQKLQDIKERCKKDYCDQKEKNSLLLKDVTYNMTDGDVDDDDDNENVIDNVDKYQPIQIYFCSRTHTQLAQVVKEIKSTVYGSRIRCICLASRQQLCINKQVKSLNSLTLINERCLELASNNKEKTKPTSITQDGCIAKMFKLRENTNCIFKNPALVHKLSDLSLINNLDIEDLVQEGEKLNACPYYAARKSIQMAQIIMLPYQLLLHRKTRQQSGINLQGNIIIIDEAHNLLDTIAQMYSCEINLQQLQTIQEHIVQYKMRYSIQFSAKNLLNINQFLFIVKRLLKLLTQKDSQQTTKLLTTYELITEGDFFNINIHDLLQFCEQTRFPQKLQGFISNNNKHQDNIQNNDKCSTSNGIVKILKNLEEKTKRNKKIKTFPNEELNSEHIEKTIKGNVISPIRPLLTFLESLTEKAEDGRILINICNEKNLDYKIKTSFKYLLLNPGAHFQDVIDEARAIVIAGGTMQPTADLTEQLFYKCPERVNIHCYDHVVPSNAVLAFVVGKGPSGRNLCFSYKERVTLEMLNDLSSILKNLCNVVQAGLVCFVPSYDYLDMLYNHLQITGAIEYISSKKIIYKESPNNTTTEQLLHDYAKSIRLHKSGGALLLSVVGGKLSEGLNFTNDLGRGVIVVGLPYPNRNSPELQERMLYLNKTFEHNAGQEYYENLCMKAVNQCIGRAVRHINDYACVYLLDERYNRKHIKNKLPQWISRNLKICNNYGEVQSSTVKFFKQHKQVN